MKRARIRELKVGMKVFLTHPDPTYTIDQTNPAIGSRYEAKGVVSKVRETSAIVHWPGGMSNIYRDLELSVADDVIGNCVSIW